MRFVVIFGTQVFSLEERESSKTSSSPDAIKTPSVLCYLRKIKCRESLFHPNQELLPKGSYSDAPLGGFSVLGPAGSGLWYTFTTKQEVKSKRKKEKRSLRIICFFY
jgi:hypothetical protein